MLLKRTTHTIANPFSTKSNKFFPQTIKECFDWALYMHDRFPVIGRAINKVVRYFAADISVNTLDSPSLTDNDKLLHTRKLITENYNALLLIIKIGLLLATMGNVFIYALPVISRTLCCPTHGCNFSVALKNLRPKLDYLWDGEFKGTCPQCHKKVTFKVVDKITTDIKGRKTIFRCYSARDIELKYNLLTDLYTYLYKMPSHIKLAIITGDPVYLSATPQVFLKAAFTGDYIEFPKDKFLHLRTDCLASMDRFYKGWGTPLFLSSFSNVLRLAYLDKFNEAVATDFIAPIRMISPPAQNLMAGQDGLRQPISGHAVKNFIFDIVKGIRLNPSQWVVSPFPLQYQMLGGEAKQLAPVELMRWYELRILLDMAIPVLLRQTTFQAVAPSIGLRMFLRQWIHFTKNLLFALMWLSDIICDIHMLDRIKVNLDKTSFVLDDMHKQTILNMGGSGLISNTTVLKTIGLDFKELQHKRMQEDQDMALEALKAQNAQQEVLMTSSVLPPPGSVGVGAAQFNMLQVQMANMPQDPAMAGAPMPPSAGGAPAAPMMPAGTLNSKTIVMLQLFQEAQAKAQLIADVGRMQGAGARRSMLIKLKAQNPLLHAQVKAILEQMDQDVASQAVAQSKMPG